MTDTVLSVESTKTRHLDWCEMSFYNVSFLKLKDYFYKISNSITTITIAVTMIQKQQREVNNNNNSSQ